MQATCLLFLSDLVGGWCHRQSSRAHHPRPANLPKHWPEGSSSPTGGRFWGASGVTRRTKSPKTNNQASAPRNSQQAPLLRPHLDRLQPGSGLVGGTGRLPAMMSGSSLRRASSSFAGRIRAKVPYTSAYASKFPSSWKALVARNFRYEGKPCQDAVRLSFF